MPKIEKHTTLETLDCANCGITFAIPDFFMRNRRDDHNNFYCPNGHIQYYPAKTAAEIAREEIVTLKARIHDETERARRARQDAEHFEASRNAYKGQVTKLKNRAAAGVCPCCNRHFTALERHMATKHPGFKKEDEGTTAS